MERTNGGADLAAAGAVAEAARRAFIDREQRAMTVFADGGPVDDDGDYGFGVDDAQVGRFTRERRVLAIGRHYECSCGATFVHPRALWDHVTVAHCAAEVDRG